MYVSSERVDGAIIRRLMLLLPDKRDKPDLLFLRTGTEKQILRFSNTFSNAGRLQPPGETVFLQTSSEFLAHRMMWTVGLNLRGAQLPGGKGPFSGGLIKSQTSLSTNNTSRRPVINSLSN